MGEREIQAIPLNLRQQKELIQHQVPIIRPLPQTNPIITTKQLKAVKSPESGQRHSKTLVTESSQCPLLSNSILDYRAQKTQQMNGIGMIHINIHCNRKTENNQNLQGENKLPYSPSGEPPFKLHCSYRQKHNHRNTTKRGEINHMNYRKQENKQLEASG